MQDSEIIELFFARDQEAIAATSEKYNNYCMTVAMNILQNPGDSEECVNDAYLAAWNSIPPNRPEKLSAYLARLTRNLSLNRYKARSAERRGGGDFAVSLDELDDCIADESSNYGAEELGALISRFLYTATKESRQVFVRRYFYSDSVSAIAKRFRMSESKVKSMLHRMRGGLRDFLAANDIQV